MCIYIYACIYIYMDYIYTNAHMKVIHCMYNYSICTWNLEYTCFIHQYASPLHKRTCIYCWFCETVRSNSGAHHGSAISRRQTAKAFLLDDFWTDIELQTCEAQEQVYVIWLVVYLPIWKILVGIIVSNLWKTCSKIPATCKLCTYTHTHIYIYTHMCVHTYRSTHMYIYIYV